MRSKSKAWLAEMKDKPTLGLDDWLLVAMVAEQASLVAAAQQLGVSHATAFRRLGALEQRLGVRLFERRAGRYAATSAGDVLADAGRRMQTEADAALLRVQGQDLRPQGLVRIASTEGVIGGLLMPLLPSLRKALPDLKVHCSARNEFHNLSQREADLALRPATSPPDHLIGHRIGALRHAVYAQREKALRFRQAAYDRQVWIALDESATGSNGLRWLAQFLPLEQVTMRFSGLITVRSACVQGLGLALLPCFLGDVEPRLVRIGEPVPMCDSELWLLSHPELRETARIKALRQWLLNALSKHADLLAGLKPLP